MTKGTSIDEWMCETMQRMKSDGYSNYEIAEQFGVAEGTVRYHTGEKCIHAQAPVAPEQ